MTGMVELVSLRMERLLALLAVTVVVPAVMGVRLNWPVPPLKAASAGRIAAPSLEVR